MCHDYQPGGREVQFVSTVADERAHNVHVRNGISEESLRGDAQARDATLGMPTLILPSGAGEHARRPAARARSQRHPLHQDPAERGLTAARRRQPPREAAGSVPVQETSHGHQTAHRELSVAAQITPPT
jgi:hypothetical protein